MMSPSGHTHLFGSGWNCAHQHTGSRCIHGKALLIGLFPRPVFEEGDADCDAAVSGEVHGALKWSTRSSANLSGAMLASPSDTCEHYQEAVLTHKHVPKA